MRSQGGDVSSRAREQLKRAILEEAAIVCATLSFSGEEPPPALHTQLSL